LAVNPEAIIEQAESSLDIYQNIVIETVNFLISEGVVIIDSFKQ